MTAEKQQSEGTPTGLNETAAVSAPEANKTSSSSELPARGVLEVGEKGFGFLRSPARSFQISPSDIYVSPEMIRRYQLRPGLEIEGKAAPPRRGSPQLVEIHTINGFPPEKYFRLKKFDELTSINPNERYVLETVPDRMTTRVVDLIAPIGKGTRGLIVAPPRTGKTTLLHHIADAILTNYPQTHVMVFLVDERPEETTDFRRSIKGGEVIASTNDQTIEDHVRTARIAIERARRLVEFGRDVFMVLDSLTRLARAFNNYIGSTGRTLTGGLDARAMEQPRRIFASARKAEEGGSLTIVATALIDTGSRMDELIFQEFKGTGNSELVLSRKLAEQRYWPAVDINASGTRREELLLSQKELEAVARLRRVLSELEPEEALPRLLTGLSKFKTNKEFLKAVI
ncbi:MAG: transcription termination factor Rho [Verrucomicrobiae bacterium]|nr:transcription termination factor Rho [Verrucomicrobiae bacterium]